MSAVYVSVSFGDAQSKLFRVGSMEFGLGLLIPLLLDLNCGSDCLTPTSSCVFPSPHFSPPTHVSVWTMFSAVSSFSVFSHTFPHCFCVFTGPCLLWAEAEHFVII